MKLKMLNKHAFTLIELLAVITIIGILMIIAIPSITQIIDKARKDTLFNTMDAYIESLKMEVMDGTYTFLNSEEIIYAVPIECIELESGGKNPFGNWKQAGKDYWGYVLVQYDAETQNYTFGFTYKDSVGWSLYPTAEEHLTDPQTSIEKNIDLYKPYSGTFGNIAGPKDWAGFDLNSTAELIVLESSTIGGSADYKSICPLVEKGVNYDDVQDERNQRYSSGKPCRFISGDAKTTGSVLECGGERFRMLGEREYTYVLLAEHQIELSENPRQVADADGTYFSDIRYWGISGVNYFPSSKFDGKAPTYVYGNYLGNNIYKYVRSYEDYLEEACRVKSASLTLMDSSDIKKYLGCTFTGGSYNCNSSPYISWIDKGERWFTGTVDDRGNILVFDNYNNNRVFAWGVPTPYPFDYGVRPMLVIEKSEVQ